MSSNALAVTSRSRTDASAAPTTANGITTRLPPDILTYCHGSRMVYVTPGEDYDRAVEIAVESFPELRDVERDRICLEVRVVLSNQAEKKTAEIGRSAWSVVVPTLARFEIIEIRVAPPPSLRWHPPVQAPSRLLTLRRWAGTLTLKDHRPTHVHTGRIRHRVLCRTRNPSPPALWISSLPNHLEVVILLSHVTTTNARIYFLYHTFSIFFYAVAEVFSFTSYTL